MLQAAYLRKTLPQSTTFSSLQPLACQYSFFRSQKCASERPCCPQAIYLLTTGAREAAFRNIKTIAECLADELINAAKGSSNRCCPAAAFQGSALKCGLGGFLLPASAAPASVRTQIARGSSFMCGSFVLCLARRSQNWQHMHALDRSFCARSAALHCQGFRYSCVEVCLSCATL